jgi:hypothetical protein
MVSYSMEGSLFIPRLAAERCASAAPGSRSVAEAGGRRLQAVVRPGTLRATAGAPQPAPHHL